MYSHHQHSPNLGTDDPLSDEKAVDTLRAFFRKQFIQHTDFQSGTETLHFLMHFVNTTIRTDWIGFVVKKQGNAGLQIDARPMGKQFFGSVERFIKNHSPSLHYHRRINLFYRIIRDLDWDPFVFQFAASEDANGRLAAEAFNELLRRIRETARSTSFRRLERQDAKRLENQFVNSVTMVSSIFEHKRSRVLVCRIDLKYRRAAIKKMQPGAALDDLKHLMGNARNKRNLFRHYLGFIWRHELSHDEGDHFHVFFFFDGNHFNNGNRLTELIGQYWSKNVTNGRGTFFNCNRKEYREKLKYLAVGSINYFEKAKRCNLVRAIAYFFKYDQHILVKASPKAHRTGRSPTPRDRSTLKGRPRSVQVDRWSFLRHL